MHEDCKQDRAQDRPLGNPFTDGVWNRDKASLEYFDLPIEQKPVEPVEDWSRDADLSALQNQPIHVDRVVGAPEPQAAWRSRDINKTNFFLSLLGQ